MSGKCMELTVEISQDKWPAQELLPGLFQANLPALLAFPLAAAFSGLRHAFLHVTFVTCLLLVHFPGDAINVCNTA